MLVKDLIKKLLTVDENHEVVVSVETTYDGEPTEINDCKVTSANWDGSNMVIDAEDIQ